MKRPKSSGGPGGRARAGSFSTLSVRVVVFSALMTLGIIAIALTVTYITVGRILEDETADVVQAELLDLHDRYDDGGPPDLAQAISDRSDTTADAFYLLVNSRGEALAGNVESWPAGAPLNGSWFHVELERGDEKIEVGAVALAIPNNLKLLVGRDLRAQRRFTTALLEAAGAALLAAALLAAGAGLLLNRIVMGRIGDIDQTARAIVEGDLTRRIPARSGSDEFGRLAATLNGMLERIEILVVELRTVTDSLAHDLRTPLTRLKTQIVRAADADLADGVHREALGQAADEADRVLATFSAMIDIARAEAGAAREQFVNLDLVEVVRDVFEFHQPLAEDMRVQLSFEGEGPIMVHGHAQFLAQLVSNLVDNALKHAAGKPVAMRVASENGRAVVEVADRGPGIPADQREAALKRFGRLDASRSTPGSGLGLSLAATLARMHGGELELLDNDPGLKVRVTVPVAV